MADAASLSAVSPNANLVNQMMRWEDGEMPPIEELEFFKALVASGMLRVLQGCYGRRAHTLGLI